VVDCVGFLSWSTPSVLPFLNSWSGSSATFPARISAMVDAVGVDADDADDVDDDAENDDYDDDDDEDYYDIDHDDDNDDDGADDHNNENDGYGAPVGDTPQHVPHA
jgi:ABC-type Zn2+ transport system substrate-binding protein/surface adhesin